MRNKNQDREEILADERKMLAQQMKGNWRTWKGKSSWWEEEQQPATVGLMEENKYRKGKENFPWMKEWKISSLSAINFAEDTQNSCQSF